MKEKKLFRIILSGSKIFYKEGNMANKERKPRMAPEERKRILDRAWEHVQSVDYSVSARWLFYRLLQDGLYAGKHQYGNFMYLMREVREKFEGGWRPNTLSDETRTPIIRGTGWESEEEWLQYIGERECFLDKFLFQENYLEIWYEAKAMTSQFLHYTNYITLRPFGGAASYPYLWDIAMKMKRVIENSKKTPTVLYFGDYDPSGLSIPKAALGWVEEWAGYGINFVRVALNEGDGERFGIPENPDKPGEYQWEALPDAIAGTLIQESIKPYISQFGLWKVKELQKEITERFQERWEQFIDKLH